MEADGINFKGISSLPEAFTADQGEFTNFWFEKMIERTLEHDALTEFTASFQQRSHLSAPLP